MYEDPNYDRNQMYVDQVLAFVGFIKGEADFESTLDSSVQVMQLVESIRMSSDQSAWTEVEEAL